MIINKIKTNGIYFRQSDKRIEGYYTSDSEGNLVNHKYEVTLKDKFKYLLFDKKPDEPLYTSYISFMIWEGEIVVVSGSMIGDAIKVSKEVRNTFGRSEKKQYELTKDSIIISYENTKEELKFDNQGINICCTLIDKETLEKKAVKIYSFLDWNRV